MLSIEAVKMSDILDKGKTEGSLKRKFEKMSPEEKCTKKIIHSEFEVEDDDTLMCFGKNQSHSDTASDEDEDYPKYYDKVDEWNRPRELLEIRSCAEKLIGYLKVIQGKPLYFHPVETSVIYMMGNILFFIFCVGRDCVNFSDEQKEEIGKLLVEAIEPIKLYIKHAVHFYTGSNPFILQYRSALEYLITYYADFSAKDTSLRKLLEEQLAESINMVDENITLFRNFITEDWGEWDFKENGGESVPETHTWWGTK